MGQIRGRNAAEVTADEAVARKNAVQWHPASTVVPDYSYSASRLIFPAICIKLCSCDDRLCACIFGAHWCTGASKTAPNSREQAEMQKALTD